MKTLSLKLDDDIFEGTEKKTLKMHIARKRNINEAVIVYNQDQKRKLIQKQLMKESEITKVDSLEALREFEKLMDEA